MEILIQFGVTVVAGAFGTFIGGMFLDYIRNKKRYTAGFQSYCPRLIVSPDD